MPKLKIHFHELRNVSIPRWFSRHGLSDFYYRAYFLIRLKNNGFDLRDEAPPIIRHEDAETLDIIFEQKDRAVQKIAESPVLLLSYEQGG